jgi:hypothetical protein
MMTAGRRLAGLVALAGGTVALTGVAWLASTEVLVVVATLWLGALVLGVGAITVMEHRSLRRAIHNRPKSDHIRKMVAQEVKGLEHEVLTNLDAASKAQRQRHDTHVQDLHAHVARLEFGTSEVARSLQDELRHEADHLRQVILLLHELHGRQPMPWSDLRRIDVGALNHLAAVMRHTRPRCVLADGCDLGPLMILATLLMEYEHGTLLVGEVPDAEVQDVLAGLEQRGAEGRSRVLSGEERWEDLSVPEPVDLLVVSLQEDPLARRIQVLVDRLGPGLASDVVVVDIAAPVHERAGWTDGREEFAEARLSAGTDLMVVRRRPIP